MRNQHEVLAQKRDLIRRLHRLRELARVALEVSSRNLVHARREKLRPVGLQNGDDKCNGRRQTNSASVCARVCGCHLHNKEGEKARRIKKYCSAYAQSVHALTNY